MSKTKLNKLLKFWLEELKLGGWTVTLVTDPTLVDHGNIQWDDLTKDATLWLYPTKDYARIEKVIIHELLHLVHKKWTKVNDLEEAIIHLTSVLYSMAHKEK
jgi:hypothetical protein